MKLVIEIPEEYRSNFEDNRCKEKFDSLATNEFGYVLRKAFENGKPLPKEFNNDRCDCLNKEYVPIRYEVVGYGRELNVGVSFVKREIFTHYDYSCDSGKRKSLAIKYCPFCGRKLYKAESEVAE